MKIDDLILALEEFREEHGNTAVAVCVNNDDLFYFDEEDLSLATDLDNSKTFCIDVEIEEDYE